jgi:hypothetical protein
MADKCTISSDDARQICENQTKASWAAGIPFVGSAIAAQDRNKLTAKQSERRKKLADLNTQLTAAQADWEEAITQCAEGTAGNLKDLMTLLFGDGVDGVGIIEEMIQLDIFFEKEWLGYLTISLITLAIITQLLITRLF